MVDSGTAQIVAVPAEIGQVELPAAAQYTPRLSGADRDVLTVAATLRRDYPGDEVLIATDDRDVELGGKAMGVRTLSSQEFRLLLQPGSRQDQRVLERAREVSSYQRKHLIGSAVAGALLTVTATLLVQHLQEVIATARIWGTLLAIPILGILLYWFRSRYRLAYGITEVGVGLVAAVYAVLPSFDVMRLGAAAILQLVGGFYIIVRGLDNTGLGLRGTRLGVLWARWFSS